MDLEPGQPVFIKEAHGNIWKTGTINQPDREPDSYWVRFPDDSILRRTCQKIKPRSLPSHFELETQSKKRNMQEYRTSSNQQSFQTMFPDMEQPTLQAGNLVAPAFIEQEASNERQNIPTSSSSSSGVTQPSTPVRRLAHSTKGVPPRRFSPSRESLCKVLHYHGVYPPCKASSHSTNKDTQQFTNGSQLC